MPLSDKEYMQQALALAEEQLGVTAPNPAVGCVLVKEGKVIGQGATQKGGRPHAEVVALQAAGAKARGATAYVTLEPCSHHGKTPPCAEALIAAKVAKVIIATQDPYHQVNGEGIEKLKQAGIKVELGVCEQDAQAVNAGFFKVQHEGLPLVTLKLATSLDGKIATASGESKWITCEEARQAGHELRASHDAIMVGSGTAKADNPMLNCRIAGKENRSPIRVVVDSKLQLDKVSKLVTTAKEYPTWVLTTQSSENFASGVKVLTIAADNGRVDIRAGLQALAEKGITRVLVEGGGQLAASLLKAGLVDELVWFRAPIILGDDATPAIAALELAKLDNAPSFDRTSVEEVGSDIVERYRLL